MACHVVNLPFDERSPPMFDHLIIRVSDPEGNNIEAVLHDYAG